MASYCSNMKLFKQGAEAKLYTTDFLGRSAIVKERFPKKYRLIEIDQKLTKKRVSQEIKAVQRCRKVGIHAPTIYFIDAVRNIIIFERINGLTVREHISMFRKEAPDSSYEAIYPLAKGIGKILAKLHDSDLIHGDLTTSNMIVESCENTVTSSNIYKIYLIDFGLSTSSSHIEDKGVDLYVLERAFLSTHPGAENLFAELLESYRATSKKSTAVLNKLNEVRQRGRKRSMLG